MTGDGRPARAAPGDPRGMIRETAFHDAPADTRRRARAGWPIRVFRLGEEPPDDLSDRTTAEETGRLKDLADADTLDSQGGAPDGGRDDS